MPPHCDTMDGPVVTAAKEAENEIEKAFEKTIAARKLGKQAREIADLWFFETIVRLHREGEGAPYTGLKPAGLDEGPVMPRAEKAIEEGNAKEVTEFLSHVVEEELQKAWEKVEPLLDGSPTPKFYEVIIASEKKR